MYKKNLTSANFRKALGLKLVMTSRTLAMNPLTIRLTLWSCVSVLLIAPKSGAQDKPDFSGHWALADPSVSGPTIAQELTVQMLIVRESVRGDPITPFFKTMTVERRLPSGVHSDSYQIGIEGGMVGGVVGGAGPGRQSPSQTRFSITWNGDRLVMENGSYSGPTRESGPYTEHDEVWSLDSQGRLLLTVTERASGVEPRTTQLTYRRQ